MSVYTQPAIRHDNRYTVRVMCDGDGEKGKGCIEELTRQNVFSIGEVKDGVDKGRLLLVDDKFAIDATRVILALRGWSVTIDGGGDGPDYCRDCARRIGKRPHVPDLERPGEWPRRVKVATGASGTVGTGVVSGGVVSGGVVSGGVVSGGVVSVAKRSWSRVERELNAVGNMSWMGWGSGLNVS